MTQETESLLSPRTSGATCAACDTASAGGTCPDCGLYWCRNDDGKMVALRMEMWPTQAPDQRDFWRREATLQERIDLSREIDPHLAEAVDALCRLWNIALFKLLSGQQAAVMILVHTQKVASSSELAEALGISRAAATNVLTKLVNRGLLTRERVGRRVTYSVAVLWPMGLVQTASQIAVRGLFKEETS